MLWVSRMSRSCMTIYLSIYLLISLWVGLTRHIDMHEFIHLDRSSLLCCVVVYCSVGVVSTGKWLLAATLHYTTLVIKFVTHQTHISYIYIQ